MFLQNIQVPKEVEQYFGEKKGVFFFKNEKTLFPLAYALLKDMPIE